MSKPRPNKSIGTIKREVAEWIRLIQVMHRGPDERDQNMAARFEWERARAAFDSFHLEHRYGWDNKVLSNRWDEYIARSIRVEPSSLEFAIAFLELDPWFFRSGYIKARFLENVKKASLSETQRSRLNDVLHDAVRNRSGREFRRYCRLAGRIADKALIDDLRQLSMETGAQASRARMMLELAVGSPAHRRHDP